MSSADDRSALRPRLGRLERDQQPEIPDDESRRDPHPGRIQIIRGILIGVVVGLFVVVALQFAGIPIAEYLHLPRSTQAEPGPQTGALTSRRATIIVAEQLPPRIGSLIVELGIEGQRTDRGNWRVTWGKAVWEVDAATGAVTPLTDDAKFFSSLPRE